MALDLMLQAVAIESKFDEEFKVEGPLKQDLVDWTRQLLVDVFSDLMILSRSAAAIRDHRGGQEHHGLEDVVATMMELFDDLVSLSFRFFGS